MAFDIDYNDLKGAALLLFSMAIFIETWVNWEAFFDKKDRFPTPTGLKWVTCLCFIGFSAVNIWAFAEVRENTDLGPAVVTKMLYSGFGLMVMTCLHFWIRSIKLRFIEKDAEIAKLKSVIAELESKK